MTKNPRALQVPASWPTPRTHRETYAEALKAAELEFRTAQAGLDGTDASKARYAVALATYDSFHQHRRSLMPAVAIQPVSDQIPGGAAPGLHVF